MNVCWRRGRRGNFWSLFKLLVSTVAQHCHTAVDYSAMNVTGIYWHLIQRRSCEINFRCARLWVIGPASLQATILLCCLIAPLRNKTSLDVSFNHHINYGFLAHSLSSWCCLLFLQYWWGKCQCSVELHQFGSQHWTLFGPRCVPSTARNLVWWQGERLWQWHQLRMYHLYRSTSNEQAPAPPPLSCVTQSAVFLKPPVVKTSKYTLHTLMMTPWKHLKWDFIRFQKLVLSDMVVPCSTRAPSTTYGSANYKTGLEGL